MQADRVLLDTPVLLWWQAGSSQVSPVALAAIEQADRIFVSAISFWEISTLVQKKRIVLDRPVLAWANDLLSSSVDVVDLSAEIAVTAGLLVDFHGDPADRMIYSTAQVEKMPLISKDRQVTVTAASDGPVEIIW